MDKNLRDYMVFGTVMQVLISLMFLGMRLADGMPVNEAAGKFIFAVALGTLVNAVIIWFIHNMVGKR